MKRLAFRLLCLIIGAIYFSGCNITKPTANISKQDRETYLYSLGINSAPVDLNDFDAVSRVYIQTLLTKTYFYSWETASEIKADDLIEICVINNLLNLPRDVEGVYLPESGNPSAEQVEAAIKKHCDVTSDHLRTSRWYNAPDNTYALVFGGGGSVAPIATGAEQKGNQIIIEVTLLSHPDIYEWTDSSTLPSGKLQPDGSLLTPAGILTVELDDTNVIHFISYKLNDSFRWYK